jgi:exodeoxyribonuclease-5
MRPRGGGREEVTNKNSDAALASSPRKVNFPQITELTRQQQDVAAGITGWYRNDTSQFCLVHGLAGTGKTTLITALGQSLHGVAFCAFTNKAASRLRQKGGHGARTLHSLIYRRPDEDDEGGLSWRLRPELDCELIIADEASMIGHRLGKDLMSFGVPVLSTGDPGQLPPVEGTAFFAGHRPDFILTEVHRQASNSQPLKLATAIRAGEPVNPIPFDRERMLGADIVITAVHKTRREINRMVRKARGVIHEDFADRLPWLGERICAFKTVHDAGVMNGEIWVVEDLARKDGIIRLSLADDFANKAIVRVPESDFLTGPPRQPRQDGYGSFDYGYAITAHKAQGSEWDSVCVIDETDTPRFRWIADKSGLSFDEFKARWLYTAVTRACHAVVVMGPPPP